MAYVRQKSHIGLRFVLRVFLAIKPLNAIFITKNTFELEYQSYLRYNGDNNILTPFNYARILR